jgi:hypothetical protein
VSAATVVMQAWRGQVHLSWQAGKAVSYKMRTTRVRGTAPPSARTAPSGTQLLATDLRAPSRSPCDTLHGWKSASQYEPNTMTPRVPLLTNQATGHMQSFSLLSRAMLCCLLRSRLKVLLRQIFRRAVLQACSGLPAACDSSSAPQMRSLSPAQHLSESRARLSRAALRNIGPSWAHVQGALLHMDNAS